MDMFSKEKRKEIMSKICGKNTRPELIVRSLLHKRGYRFRIHNKSLPGKPDVVLKKYKTVILINGCFWHQHPNCKLAKIPKTNVEFWKKKLMANIERQKQNNDKIIDMGYDVIILWECQINNDLGQLINFTDSVLKNKEREQATASRIFQYN